MSSAILVACAHCNTLNRVPQQRLEHAPKCGRCQQGIFNRRPVELTAANFDAHAARSELPLLIDFWAPWCQPCLQMAPHFAAAAQELEPHFRLGKLDTEAEAQLGARFAIRSIPTLALFQNGKERKRDAGARSAKEIVAWARSALSN